MRTLGKTAMLPAILLGAACAVLPQAGFSQPAEPQRQGEWVSARDTALSRIEKVRTSLDASELAGAVAQLALAEAGMGQQEDALWHWYVAQNLNRSVLSPEALSSFGPPGELLARHPLPQPGVASAGILVRDLEDPKARSGHRVHGTFRLSEDVAALPAPLALRFQIILGPEGRLSIPLVIDSGPPGMIWEILESVRDWRYQPSAHQKDKEAAVTLSVNTQCPPEGPAGRWAFRVQRAEVDTQLRAGRWKEAQGGVEALWDEILRTEQPHTVDLATLFTLRALTQAGLGMESEAVCRWQVAQLLDPRLKDLDLSFYGSAGKLLAKSRPAEEIPAGAATVEKQHELAIPPASRLIKMKGTVALAATVGTDGGVRQPHLLKTEANGHAVLDGLQPLDASLDSRMVSASRLLAVSALDTVCGWRARSENPSPVQAVFELPFEITRLGFVPANAIGGSAADPVRSEVPHHYPQPAGPSGPRSPVQPPSR